MGKRGRVRQFAARNFSQALAALAISGQSAALALDKVRKRIFCLGAPDDVACEVRLIGPLGGEVLAHVLEQQALDAHH